MDRGKCISGVCDCNKGYTGEGCVDTSCPNECEGHGKCRDFTCFCDLGWSGLDCSI